MSDKEDRSGGLFRRRPTESVSCACVCTYEHVCMYVACVHACMCMCTIGYPSKHSNIDMLNLILYSVYLYN